MQTKRTIIPPKKIINKIKDIHLDFIKDQVNKQIKKVWIIINIRIRTGWDAFKRIGFKIKDIIIKILITGCSLLMKILILDIKENL